MWMAHGLSEHLGDRKMLDLLSLKEVSTDVCDVTLDYDHWIMIRVTNALSESFTYLQSRRLQESHIR